MNILYESSSYKELKKLPHSKSKKLLRKIELLSEYPFSGKKLEGKYQGLWSLRVWPFRVVYEIRDKTLVILSITHRQSAYKKRF